ncbi:LytR family transcriptional regulator [Paenibacillus sp. PK3_47]|uniref:LCP family protein n=1 Tax=Paenibacillus sp. PK3_47 TaxID=2072642 RepID=UPI00201DC334|nr:LCP family protein [Paenibacillus sp. PK3_47]UQZ32686.1 LytR family transcriptional regulator [Paenibacillus sp. PK3_47]
MQERSTRRKAQRKKARSRNMKLSVAVVLGTCLTAGAVYAGTLYYKADRALDRISASGTAPAATASPAPSAPGASPEAEIVEEENVSKPLTFLLAGVDDRSGSGGTLNTDVLMPVVYEPVSKKLSILSIPRDMKITSSELGAHKANYYYAYYSSHHKGEELSKMRELYGNILQMDIDHMILINFAAFSGIVDELGGLDIDVPMDMRYVDNADGTNINLKKGMQHLSGKEVLDFVRYRKSNRGTAESSDFSRNERQQEVLNLILGKLDSVSGIAKWGEIIDILGDNIRTDIGKDQLMSWIMNYPSMKPAASELITLESQWKSPYVYANEEDLQEKLQKLREPLGLPPLDKRQLLDAFGIAD